MAKQTTENDDILQPESGLLDAGSIRPSVFGLNT